MGKAEALLEKHFHQVAEAPQLIAETPQNYQADDIRRVLQPIEHRPSPFIKPTLTVSAAEAMITQFSAIDAFGGGR
jgi:hypothetical protein